MAKNDMVQMLGLMFIVIIALALTPTIQTACTNAGYVPETEYKVIEPLVSNSTSALTHAARNDSTTYAWFTITTNETLNQPASTTVDCAVNITYTVATKIILFKVGVFDDGKVYNCTITYYWMSLDAASRSLVALVPLMWIVLIIAAVVVVIVYKLKTK